MEVPRVEASRRPESGNRRNLGGLLQGRLLLRQRGDPALRPGALSGLLLSLGFRV